MINIIKYTMGDLTNGFRDTCDEYLSMENYSKKKYSKLKLKNALQRKYYTFSKYRSPRRFIIERNYNRAVFEGFTIIPNCTNWKPISIEEAFKRRISFSVNTDNIAAGYPLCKHLFNDDTIKELSIKEKRKTINDL